MEEIVKKRFVLCYHRVENLYDDFNMISVSKDNFKAHIDYLKKNFDIVPFENIVDTSKDNHSVAITFDDGYYDLFTNVLPILEIFKIPATMFISTGNIDTLNENWTDNILRSIYLPCIQHDFFEVNDSYVSGKWRTQTMDDRVKLYSIIRTLFQHANTEEKKKLEKCLLNWSGHTIKGRKDRRMLSVSELQELAKNPLITIGAHTVTHCSLKWQSRQEQINEIRESKKFIETVIKKEVSNFAYPFGTANDYTSETIDILKSEGFKRAGVVKNELITDETDVFQIPRFTVRNYELSEFKNFIDKIINTQQRSIEKKSSVSKISYIGLLKEDIDLMNEENKFVIWGCGYWGIKLLEELSSMGYGDRILAFGDNDINKNGKCIENKKVMECQDVLQMLSKEKIIILIKGMHDWEIADELIKKGLYNIHILLR